MDNTIWKNIYEAVEDNDICTVSECVEDIEDCIVKEWKKGVREDFERVLRLFVQKSQRMTRDLVGENQQIPFQIGFAAGIVRAFARIHRIEGEQAGIVESLAQSSGKTRQILDCLYREREHGMQHGSLAKAIGSTASSLTNLMKRVIQSGAVEASRSGKNTYYMLTAAGEHYCAQRAKAQESFIFSDEYKKELVKLIANLLKEMKEQDQMAGQKRQIAQQNVGAGDRLIPILENEVGQEYRVNQILNMGGIKYMELMKTSTENNDEIDTIRQKPPIDQLSCILENYAVETLRAR